MCADPKIRTALLAELRQELAARKAVRKVGHGPRRWHVAAFGLAACLALFAII